MTALRVVIVGSGPAGQKAAIQAAKCGAEVHLVEQSRHVGGECVLRGTIPSKTLRERASRELQARLWLRERAGCGDPDGAADYAVRLDLLGESVARTIASHGAYMTAQLCRNGVQIVRGRARFRGDPRVVEVVDPSGAVRTLAADRVILATGSIPRHPPGITVDHEFVLDSDSILTLNWLPRRLAVLGGGVIACEYATIFAALGVEVLLIDRAPRPLGFLDHEVVDVMLAEFARNGGRFHGNVEVQGVTCDPLSGVAIRTTGGELFQVDKALCALGRVSSTRGLGLETIGVRIDARGLISVDAHGCTSVPGIYAAGDVAGPPSLASAAMEQGRRVARNALDVDADTTAVSVPTGIYSLPEIGAVGATEAEAVARGEGVRVGRARFEEIARGHISDATCGLLKLVAAADGRIIGVHAVGVGAADLVHVGQVAISAGWTAESFVENIFNFPTFAEAYRVAALQICAGDAGDSGDAAGADGPPALDACLRQALAIRAAS